MWPNRFLLGSRWELFLKLKNPIATLNAMHELLTVLQNEHFLWHGGQLNIYKVTQFHRESHHGSFHGTHCENLEVKSGACYRTIYQSPVLDKVLFWTTFSSF